MYQTMSSVGSFLLMMVLHPDAQSKGQEEIDRVIGRNRLPTFEDRLSLPYIEAIYREVMRLHPALPLGKHMTIMTMRILNYSLISGLQHSLTDDDVYQGYYIPKGCIPMRSL